MAKNAFDDYSTTAASNTDIDGVDSTGATGLVKSGDNYTRSVMSHAKAKLLDLGAVNTVAGTGDAVTVTLASNTTAFYDGMRFSFNAPGTNTGAATIAVKNSAGTLLGTPKIRKWASGVETALSAGDMTSNHIINVVYDSARDTAAGAFMIDGSASVAAATTSAAGIVELTIDAEAKTKTDTSRAITASNLPGVLLDVPQVRQTVLSGPVTTAGLSNFGGSTGSTTVTTSGTLIATAAYGAVNRTGSATNPAWTGLSTNGTMYLYTDIAADGTWTTGSTTVAPVYQWGGTPATTSGLFTFNIQEMAGYVGNGSTAPQTYRVFVGEVTVSGSVTTVITWYSLMGRYRSALTALRSSAGADSFSHNLGTIPRHKRIVLVNSTAELGYAVGDEIDAPIHYAGSGTYLTTNPICGALTAVVGVPTTMAGGGLGFYFPNKSTGATVGGPTTAASWRYKIEIDRGW
jgi:hypothetical protein